MTVPGERAGLPDPCSGPPVEILVRSRQFRQPRGRHRVGEPGREPGYGSGTAGQRRVPARPHQRNSWADEVRCRGRAPPMNTRRQFLIRAPLGFLTAAALCRNGVEASDAPPRPATAGPPATPGAPPTFGTGAGSGPAVSPATFAEAEKLMQVTMMPVERRQAAETWRQSLAPYLERRTGPR